MCFVFGETKEVDEETVQLIEDLVRSQLTALVSHLFLSSRAVLMQDFR